MFHFRPKLVVDPVDFLSTTPSMSNEESNKRKILENRLFLTLTSLFNEAENKASVDRVGRTANEVYFHLGKTDSIRS